MIPISDQNRRQSFPWVTLLLVSINVVVFVFELSLNDRQLQRFMMSFGLVPRELATLVDLPPAGPRPIWLTIFTSMFIHAGWLHIGGNMLYLWVFGDNVEDAMGKVRFLVFYLASGVAASLAQTYVDPRSTVPSVGASGAIAGVLGAYLVLYPSARVNTLFVFFFRIFVVPIPAVVVIGFWALTQFFSGAASLGIPTGQTEGVAYWAHIGGFVAGMVLVLVFWPRRRSKSTLSDDWYR